MTQEEIAKSYGIKTNDIKHIILDNGREFFKFYDSNNQKTRMIANNVVGEFQSIQQELSFTQSNSNKGDSASYLDRELVLVPMDELKNNRFKYMRQINRLSTIDRKKVKALIKSSKQISLQYINIENAIGIDNNDNVIDVNFDFLNNRATIKPARIINYQAYKEDSMENNVGTEIATDEFDKIASEMVANGNIIAIRNSELINVHGQMIDKKTVYDLYEMPDAIDRLSLPANQKFIYEGIINAINRCIQNKQKEQLPQKQKVLINKESYRDAA